MLTGDRNCAGFVGLWRRVLRKRYIHLTLFVALVGLLLFGDAGFYQGCWKESSCSGLPLQQATKALLRGEEQLAKTSGHRSQESEFQRASERKSIYKDFLSTGLGINQAPVVQAAVDFNDSVLLLLSSPILGLRYAFYGRSEKFGCLFAKGVETSVLNVEDDIVHCRHPEHEVQKSILGSTVTLKYGSFVLATNAVYGNITWAKLVYGFAPLADEGDLLLFVKGLSHTKRSRLPKGLECQYGDKVRTKVVTFCQENVRCKLPPQHLQKELSGGEQVTLVLGDKLFPSVSRFSLNATRSDTHTTVISEDQKPFFLCVCTLLWNGAKFLREWVMYHSYLGVEKFFLYDNNSDDDLEDVLESLHSYNISRHPWPWLKTQEASFSHCAVRASSQCIWIAFIDLDEFIFPKKFLPPKMNQSLESSLHSLVKEYDRANRGKLGQLKISNFNFGPSGLKTLPKSGQMVNYICRSSLPRRVKSIVRVSAMHPSYCSRVHFFELQAGYRAAQAGRVDAIINHYKYHVWEDFKLKFVRRAATFVANWEENKDLDSFDRTPGLGTHAVEPSDWAHQFCEIEDTSLRDFVRNTSHLCVAGKLIWE